MADHELNPNHPVTSSMHHEWHKIVALLLLKYNLGHVVITENDIMEFNEKFPSGAVVANPRHDGIHVWIVSEKESLELARDEAKRQK